MASNSLGEIFKITTWGESHGKAIGVVIDGCPAGISISEEEINYELYLRRPGRSAFVSPRKEPDSVEILSGILNGVTLGSPISLIIYNKNVDSSSYEKTKNLFRAGHADYAYFIKYGLYDYKGGGRSSARETVARVAAGTVAKKILSHYNISILAYLVSIGSIDVPEKTISSISMKDREKIKKDPFFCPDKNTSNKFEILIKNLMENKDSIGGKVECRAEGLPKGLGSPIYKKLNSCLAQAIMSLPAVRGIEFGKGFQSSKYKNSEDDNALILDKTLGIIPKKNHSGGLSGGISNGLPLIFNTVFKAPSSTKRKKHTINHNNKPVSYQLPSHARHDVCVAIRAVPVIESMTALTLCDAILTHRVSKI